MTTPMALKLPIYEVFIILKDVTMNGSNTDPWGTPASTSFIIAGVLILMAKTLSG
jgi:hypothetical protein